MKKINLTIQLPTTYTFVGNNRDASASVVSDTPVTPKIVNTYQGGSSLSPVEIPAGYINIRQGNSNISIPKGSPVRITKARILSAGAMNLQSAPGKNAAEIKMAFTGNFTANPSYFTIAFVNWNEWEEKNIVVDIKNEATFEISILAGSVIRMDDYNIQDAYIGQSFTAIMEIELQVND